MLLDAAADEKVSWGSYHAVTDMIPSLAVRYPYMCYGFLAGLALQKVGDLEVPVDVITEIDRSVGKACVGGRVKEAYVWGRVKEVYVWGRVKEVYVWGRVKEA